MKPLDRKRLFFMLLVIAMPLIFVAAAHADTIGLDDWIDFARLIVLPEDGSGGIAVPDAVQFNTGFTLTAAWGYIACYVRALVEVLR